MFSHDEHKFITTEPLDNRGEKGEKLVWNIIKKLFAHRECLAYWRYPIFSQTGKFRKEPDILMADLELGLIIIEIKSITIDQIVNINGHRWQYQNYYTNYGNPYQQAENQLFTLLQYTNREPSLKKQVAGRVLITLPYISQAQWQEKGFDKLPTNPPIIFSNNLDNIDLIEQIIKPTLPLVYGQKLKAKQWQLLLAVLAGSPVLSKPQHRVLAPPQSRGQVLQKLRSHLHQLDLQQEKIAKQIPPGPQRIRGIAGSGKTVLLCQKAVNMHLKNPDWKIALVFFSRSLYQQIIHQVEGWLRYFSNNQLSYQPNNKNLLILHAWGSQKQPGLYSLICQEARVKKLTANDTDSKQPNEALGEACYYLLKQASIPQIFDAILIDEGQDLMVDNWKFNHKQPFYWLAYQALRPANSLHPEQKRLIWAYDEVQSLQSLNLPVASEIFGEELGHLVTGKYPDNINKTEIMPRCYRTPHQIINAAFAIGMGLLRPQGMLTGITQPKEWEALGYQVTGEFNLGEKIIVKRPLANSPHPISKFWQGYLIQFQVYYSRQQELTALANHIFTNLRNEGLRPSQEILVIILGSFYDAVNLENHVANFLIKQGIEVFIPGRKDSNMLTKDKPNQAPNKFWYEGAVTVSRIHRAKGNEADMVYIVGLDGVAKHEDNLYLRTQLFIALTRARAWVNISGIGNHKMYEEMEKVIASGDTFSFIFRHQPQREIRVTDAAELLQRFALGGRNFQNIDLEKADLKGVYLANANLIGANLQQANLRSAHLDGVKLVVADLRNSDLTGISLKKAKLMGALLSTANLTGANLQGADLTNADLSHAKLIDANLADANLNGVNLTGANLTNAKLPH
jgi:superfamily I DNA and RNA helicase